MTRWVERTKDTVIRAAGKSRPFLALVIAFLCLSAVRAYPEGMLTVYAADDLADAADTLMEDILEEADLNATLEDVYDILMGDNGDLLDAMIGSDGTGTLVMTVMQTIALSMLAFFVLLELLQTAARDQLNMDAILAVFTKMSVAVMFVIYAPEILEALDYIGQYVLTIVTSAANNSVTQAEAEVTEYLASEETGRWAAFVDLTSNVLTFIMNKILTVSIKAMSFALFIELAVRKAFMPLAIVASINGGPRDPGVRFMKRYLACYIRMCIIILAIAAVTVLSNMSSIASSNPLYLVWETMALKAAAMSVARSGARYADEILGVRD